MRIPRIYQDCALQVGASIDLDAQAAVHIAKVLRLKAGQAITLFNGRGGEYAGQIQALERRSVRIRLTEHLAVERESDLRIQLGQCISRGDRMDFAVQKAVELGVHSIIPLNSERSGLHLSGERAHKRLEHWQRIAISACEQCGRNRVPEVQAIQSLPDWVAQCKDTPSIVLALTETYGLQALKPPESGAVNVLIGPEGGLSEQEVELAKLSDFQTLALGPRVLRTETATAVALALLQERWGDLGG